MSEEFTPDNLLAGSFPIVTEEVTIVSGAGSLVRGTVLGVITASSKLQTSLAAATDGSEDVYAILAEDVDASDEDKMATVYLAGEFNGDALTLGTGWTVALVKAAFRTLGIFIRDDVQAA